MAVTITIQGSDTSNGAKVDFDLTIAIGALTPFHVPASIDDLRRAPSRLEMWQVGQILARAIWASAPGTEAQKIAALLAGPVDVQTTGLRFFNYIAGTPVT